MAVTIGSVTEGNANAEEIKNNSPDSELYENNKKYLQGSLVKFNDKIYLAKRNVPSDVDLDNPYYWEIFMDAADSKRVDELFEKTGNLDELETESKDNLVAAINEVGSIQPDWAQNDETAKDYIKNRTHWIEEKTVLEETTFTIEESDDSFVLGNFPVTLSDGDICTVVYDGKTYTCTVFEFGTDIAGISCDAFEIVFQNQPDGLCAITIGAYAGEHTISILQTTYHTIPDEFIPWEESPTATSVLYTAQSLTEEQKVQARQNIGAQDLYNCVQTNKENILGDNGSIISNSSRGNSLTISNGVIEQKNSNQNTISLGDAKVVFSYDSDGSSSTKGNGTFAMYGKKGEEYFKFKATNGDVKVSGIATPTLSNDAVNKSYVDLQIANIEIPTVPTNVSAFTNDAGYLTEHQSLADYALKSEIPSPYSLPTASATELGGVKADSAEAADTQPVRIGGDGKLYTAAGGTDISLGLTSAAVGQIIKVKAIDESGKPTEWEAADMPSGGVGASYRSWSKVWTLAVAEDIAGFEANNIDLDGKSEIMIVFISDSTASRTMTNGRIYINGVDAGKVLFNSLPLRKDSHSFVIIGRADEGIEYTTMAAKAEYQTYPWQGDVNVVHRMVSGTASSIMQWTAGSTIKITQASATLGQGVTIEIYVR